MSSWFRESRVVYTGIFAYCVFCPLAAHFYRIPLFFFFFSYTPIAYRSCHKEQPQIYERVFPTASHPSITKTQ
jgi:hypothetical protein